MRIWLRAGAYIVLCSLFVFIPTPSAKALSCPPGMSTLDCDALTLGGTSWKPDNGGLCSATVAVSVTLPDSVPAVYKTIFEQSAAKVAINPQLLTAIFVTEHGNSWPNPKGPWASSPVGASGPFQFMPGTWASYGQGKDIQSLVDSSDAAARYLHSMGATTNSPLGTLDKPYQRKPPTMLYMSGSYNAGGGNMQMLTTPSSGVAGNGLPAETVNYVKNVYYLINTGFSHGNPGYGSPSGAIKNNTGGATTPSTTISGTGACSSGASASGVAQEAISLSWPDKGHGKDKQNATTSYQTAMPQAENGDPGNDAWSDCGVFVATVMRKSGADPSYPPRGSTSQLAYVKNHPTKYNTFTLNNVAQLHPGDVLINTQHTYIFVRVPTAGGFNSADASWQGHVPQAQNAFLSENGEGFTVARLVQ